MNLKLFKKRLIAFYSCWKRFNADYWGNSDVIVITTPPKTPSPADRHRISSFFFLWLLGNDLPDTTAVFTRSDIYFICPKNKTTALQSLVAPAFEASEVRISVIQKDSKGMVDGIYDGLAKMDEILGKIMVASLEESEGFAKTKPYNSKANRIILDLMNDEPPPRRPLADGELRPPLVVGYISGECPKSKVLWSCHTRKNPKYRGMSVDLGFVKLFSGRVKLGEGVSEEKSDVMRDLGLESVVDELVSKVLRSSPEAKITKEAYLRSSSELDEIAKVGYLQSSLEANFTREATLGLAKLLSSGLDKVGKVENLPSSSGLASIEVAATKELKAAGEEGKPASLCEEDGLKKSVDDEYCLVSYTEKCDDWEFVDVNEVDARMNKVNFFKKFI